MNLEKELLDAFDRVVHQDHPNPERIDYPGTTVLQKLAAEPVAVQSESILAHIRRCAPCFDELKELRRRRSDQRPQIDATAQVLHRPDGKFAGKFLTRAGLIAA
jgi:hypothetical protein